MFCNVGKIVLNWQLHCTEYITRFNFKDLYEGQKNTFLQQRLRHRIVRTF